LGGLIALALGKRGDNSYKETYECETVNMVDVIVYNATLRGWYHYLNRTARNVARHAMARLKATVAQATGERATAGGTEASV
jgi:hypothetical protein